MDIKNLVKYTVEVLKILIKLYKNGKISYDEFIKNVELKKKFLESFGKNVQIDDVDTKEVLLKLDEVYRDRTI